MQPIEPRPKAILLLGPSGVGKTPLGGLFEQRGLNGQPCVHFDFGAELRRRVDENHPDDWVSREEIDFLRGVLELGILLEDRHFPLAARILGAFLVRRGVDRSILVVLNGLPRHVGQAASVEAILDVVTVACLECDEETILRRIATNSGGDRTTRIDDDTAKVRSRFRIYLDRTVPLLDYYRREGTVIQTIQVTATMTPLETWAEFTRRQSAV